MPNRQQAEPLGTPAAPAITSSRHESSSHELPPPARARRSAPARGRRPQIAPSVSLRSLRGRPPTESPGERSRPEPLRGRSGTDPSRAFGLAFTAAWLVLGCVYDPTAGAGGGGGAGGGTDTPTSLDGTDLQVCGDACAILAGCGAQLDQTQCKTDCANSPGVVSCFRGVTPTCDPLASCVWSAVCNGASPSGSQSCAAAESCAANCGGDADPLCLCGCAAQARPDASGDFYVLVTCLNVRCGLECSLSGDVVSCDDCLATQCSAAAAQCN